MGIACPLTKEQPCAQDQWKKDKQESRGAKNHSPAKRKWTVSSFPPATEFPLPLSPAQHEHPSATVRLRWRATDKAPFPLPAHPDSIIKTVIVRERYGMHDCAAQLLTEDPGGSPAQV